MSRADRRKAARLRERWLRGVAKDSRADDDTFRALVELSKYADENGEITIDNGDGTFETLRLAFPWETR